MKKTKLLYLTNSFMYECSARVVGVEGDDIALDATLFYPGGGGQMADRGVISWENQHHSAHVVATHTRDNIIWHTLDDLPPTIGTEVVGTIDWDFRYKMMRMHTALHILGAIIWKEFRVQATGSQAYPDRARLDVALEQLDKEQVDALEAKVNEAISADYPIRVYTLPGEKAMEIPDLLRTRGMLSSAEQEEIRVVEIVGLDRQADGGTHVNHTREVGGIHITRADMRAKVNRRIEFVLTE